MQSKREFSTEAELAKLTALDGKDTIYRDAKTTGLCVRISGRTSRKTFFYEYRPPGCRHATKRNLKKIATLKEARLKVSAVKAELLKGEDMPHLLLKAMLCRFNRARNVPELPDCSF